MAPLQLVPSAIRHARRPTKALRIRGQTENRRSDSYCVAIAPTSVEVYQFDAPLGISVRAGNEHLRSDRAERRDLCQDGGSVGKGKALTPTRGVTQQNLVRSVWVLAK